MLILAPLLLAVLASQSASDVAVLTRASPERIEAYGASGQLLWTIVAPEGVLPEDLAPEDAQHLIAGTSGGIAVRELGQGDGASGGAALLGSAPPCIAWDAPTAIGTFPQNPWGPTVHDSAGNAWVALWTAGPAGLHMVRSNRHTGSWEAPVSIQTGALDYPATTVAPNDDVTVVWRRIHGPNYLLYAARYTSAGGWEPPVLVHSSTVFIQYFDVIATDQNDVILAFLQGLDGPTPLMVALFDHASGTWGSASAISPPGVEGSFCALRCSPDFAQVAVAYMDFKTQKGLYHHVWDGGAKAFGPATTIPGSGDFGGFAGGPWSKVPFAVGNDGGSTFFWLRKGATLDLVGSRFESGAWGASNPVLVPGIQDLDIGLAVNPLTVDVSPSGQVIAAYPLQTTGATYDLIPLHFVPGAGFHVGPQLAALTHSSLASVVFYAGERAMVLASDQSVPFTHDWNGAAWSMAPNPIPGISGNPTLSAGGGEALIVDSATSFVLASWRHGTTAFADLGGGTSGAAGIPHFDGFCDQVVGQDVAFELTGAAPNAPLVIILGTSQVNFPFAGGTIVPAPDLLLPQVTDAAGELHLMLPWPPGAGSLVTFYYQVAVLDPLAQQGVALSNAMAGTTP